jgi:hypothetical protein
MVETIRFKHEGYFPCALKINEFECKGVWWVIGNPDKKVTGMFKFTQENGGILRLDGLLDSPQFIYGNSEENENITLNFCRILEFEKNSNGDGHAIFQIPETFVGALINPISSLKEVYVYYSNLDNWAQDMSHEQLNVIIDPPASVQGLDLSEFEVALCFEELENNKTYIKLCPVRNNYLFSDYLKIINHIQNFLSLGVGEPVYPLWIKGLTENEEKIDVFAPQIINKPILNINPVYMAFTLDKIDFNSIIFFQNFKPVNLKR